MDLGIIADDRQGSHPDPALPPGATLTFANMVDLPAVDHQQSLAAAANADDTASTLFRTTRLPPTLPPLHPPHHDDPISQYELPALGASSPHNALMSLFAPLPPTVDATSTTAPAVRGRPRSTPLTSFPSVSNNLAAAAHSRNPMRFSWSDHPENELVGDLTPLSSQLPQPPSVGPATTEPPPPVTATTVTTTAATAMTAAVTAAVTAAMTTATPVTTATTTTTTAAATAPSENRKRKRSSDAEPAPAPAASSTRNPTIADDDANCCQICLENWNSSGEHQICCLPCGHLFGRKCIKTWLAKRKLCPTCKRHAKVRDIRLIFGAPTYLAAQDEGDLSQLRSDLAKEVAEHTRTKRRLQEAKQNIASLNRRLTSLQPSIHTFGHQNSRQHSRQSVHARQSSRSMAQQQPRTGTIIGISPVVTSAIQTATTATRAPTPQVHVAEMDRVITNGASKALVFDNSGYVLFGEKRNSRQHDFSPQRIARSPLSNTDIRSTSRAEFFGRVTDLSVCRNMDSNYHSYIAVANQARKLHILSSSLDEVMSYNTPSPPLSCLWMVSQPQLVITGLLNGMVCAYDIRMAGSDPLYTGKVQSPGNCAVHSLAEIPLFHTNQTMLLAASPVRIDAASFNSFNGNMTLEEVQRDGPSAIEQCTSLSVDRDQVLITTRQTGSARGRHSIFPGLIPVMNLDAELTPIDTPDNRTLHFGRALANLEGHRQGMLYEPASVIAGEGADGTVVLSGDAHDNLRSTRVWEQRGHQSTDWTSAQIAPMATSSSSMVVRSYTLPQSQNVQHVGGARVRAVAGHLGDSCLQLFAVTRRPGLL